VAEKEPIARFAAYVSMCKSLMEAGRAAELSLRSRSCSLMGRGARVKSAADWRGANRRSRLGFVTWTERWMKGASNRKKGCDGTSLNALSATAYKGQEQWFRTRDL